jgi:formiminotetrahydrofolate cyclodeaminase
MKHATDVPLQTARAAIALYRHADIVTAQGNPNASSDVGVARQLAVAAGLGAVMNVETNLSGISDADYVAHVKDEIAKLRLGHS